MIWREKRVLLIILGLLLAANLAFFLTYRVQYRARLEALEERHQMSAASLERARDARMKTEQQYKSYRKVEKDVQFIYDQKWSTQGERLSPLITEVKRLSVASQLIPRSYNFTRVEAKGPQLKSRGRRESSLDATEVGISFGVEGQYEQVRRLINLLELSDQFVIIDSISLSSQTGDSLQVNLHLKTLFRGAPPESDTETETAASKSL
ncbi:MAG TPA: hypothetical protein VMU84_09535 [Thermoanaerobaculia bacterium]|nr:hypothetical protein [Thermoanaerobaculia bacterium]